MSKLSFRLFADRLPCNNSTFYSIGDAREWLEFKFRAPANETKMSCPIKSQTSCWVHCVEQLPALSWTVTSYGSHRNCRQTPCERSSSRPSLSSQALSSPPSTSSDCSHHHTTTNKLSALHMQSVRELVAIFVALHGNFSYRWYKLICNIAITCLWSVKN